MAHDRPPIVIDADTRDAQRVAAHPANSAWVSANAGSGKTHVLSTRVIRLLLAGAKPGSILCLTYTKAAAAEMKNRVFQRLAQWTLLDDATLRKQIAEIGNIDSDAVDYTTVTKARTLFASALDTPGGLKIQTIHGFCEKVLHRFPLEANIAGHFELLDGRMEETLFGRARDDVLSAPDPVTSAALSRLIAKLGETTLDQLFKTAIADRLAYEAYERHSHDGAGLDVVAARRAAWRRAAGLGAELTEAQVIAAYVATPGVLDVAAMREFVAALEPTGASRPIEKLCIPFRAWQAGRHHPAIDRSFLSIFLNQKLEPYTTGWLNTKDVKTAAPWFGARYEITAEAVRATLDTFNLMEAVDNGVDFITVISAMLERYGRYKKRGGYLDFTDLIERTAWTLKRPDVGPWVRYKLDEGIDHLLVDEAQDTSPIQWEVIRSLTGDFFDGETARTAQRTVFAVGDEKQSIYSFQGAEPEAFDRQRTYFSDKIAKGQPERPLQDVRLPASFRTTGDVLGVVDRVFADPDHADGLITGGMPVEHRSLRAGQPGMVELWEPVFSVTNNDDEDWMASAAHTVRGDTEVAKRVAADIHRRIAAGAVIAGRGRPLAAGDVLVLVRTRSGDFIRTLSAELKALGVPVAGADRVAMLAHPAIKDLMALGKAMLDADDDLSLAELVKSPILDGSEDDLFTLAAGRSDATSLWDRLAELAADNERHGRWLDQLTRWRARASAMPVFEFFGSILVGDGIGARLRGRLGPETSDIIDEFLAETMASADRGIRTLQAFIAELETSTQDIKREMDEPRDEVRVMTVHGAKGLEAPFVYVIDNASRPVSSHDKKLPVLAVETLRPDKEAPEAHLLLVPGIKEHRPALFNAVREARDLAARREYRRLLYVAMTRAADCLVIAGWRHANDSKDKSGAAVPAAERRWLDMAKAMLVEAGDGTAVAFDDHGFAAWRIAPVPTHETIAVSTPPAKPWPEADKAPETTPDWLRGRAPKEPPVPKPLTPSGASVLAIEAAQAQAAMSVDDTGPSQSLLERLRDGSGSDDTPMALAARRGTAIHRLIEVLSAPDMLHRADRADVAALWLSRVDSRWSADQRAAMVADVMAVLDLLAGADMAGVSARAEVAVMGTVVVHGQPRAVSGTIDRLVVSDDTVRIIDFKTNAAPPRHVAAIPGLHKTQLALYRALIAPLYPDKRVICTLVYTSGPHVHDLDPGELDDCLGTIAST